MEGAQILINIIPFPCIMYPENVIEIHHNIQTWRYTSDRRMDRRTDRRI